VRIVSLLPSATEILFAIGAGDDVVGVTFECDHPAEARSRRIVSTSALPEGLPPAQIDAHVTERLAAGEDLYHLDAGALAGLDADLVVTQDLCAVCAVDVSVVDDALAYLGCRAEVLTLDPQTLGQVLGSVATLGEATGRKVAADALVELLRRRLRAVAEVVAGREPVSTLVLEWTDPPFSPGHWVPEMVAAAGGRPVLGRAGARSERTTWEAVRAAGAEVVVAAPCGFGLADSARLAAKVADRLPADVPVWAVDANASFARPGPRLVDGVEALAAILHPDAGVPLDPNLAERVR
jgi:iron complex transport system substrate-binding protein